MSVRCFLIEQTDHAHLGLRRYRERAQAEPKCPAGFGYHNAIALIDVVAARIGPDGCWAYDGPEDIARGDPRWPATCPCGYVFTTDDEWQVWRERIWRRVDTGEETTLRLAAPGAMWDATWLHDCQGGSFLGGPNTDGRCLVVRLPNGRDWCIDSRASNCTLPDDNTHRCWVRHGEPPNIHVDKNGNTCAAGAGSILSGDYHGFLQNGELT